MRLLCLPYFQETGGTHRFSGRGFIINSTFSPRIRVLPCKVPFGPSHLGTNRQPNKCQMIHYGWWNST